MISLDEIETVANQGPYCPRWESLAMHPNPAWFADAKFGIFTHWGLYTVPEYRNEWYSRNMYIEGYPEFDYHRRTYGLQSDFGYRDFIPLFTAPAFNADEWVSLFADAGARYIMPVSEHHDGFQMYKSDLSQYNTVEMGPHRDVLGELREAAKRAHLHFTTSNHRAEHWWFMGHGREFPSDIHEPMSKGDFYWPAMTPEPNEFDTQAQPTPTQEFLEDWLLRVAEVIVRYEPELLYFDWWIQHRSFAPYLRLLAAFYYNYAASHGIEVAICYKYDALAWGSGIVDVERGGFSSPTPFVWQTDTAIARNSWCYTKTLDYKSLSELITTLITTVSNNGNLLLNIGPRADGSIAEHDRQLLEGIGSWLTTFGDGIYCTRPWRIAQEGPTQLECGMFADQTPTKWTAEDWRFTSREGIIYAFCLAPHHADALTCTTFAAWDGVNAPIFNGEITQVSQLGSGSVSFQRTQEGLHILPNYTRIQDCELPIGFALTIDY